MEVTSRALEQHDASGWQLEQYGRAKNIPGETWTFVLGFIYLFIYCFFFFFFTS